ncbi:MAG: cyclic lactone autoinducer peptide [Clostridia bacterium]|nr:cyclic lactone autoinducer peptide [Clostridia bacterium]
MLGKLKVRFLSTVATLALSAGLLGVQPACPIFFYQPEVPEHLRDN